MVRINKVCKNEIKKNTNAFAMVGNYPVVLQIKNQLYLDSEYFGSLRTFKLWRSFAGSPRTSATYIPRNDERKGLARPLRYGIFSIL